MECNKEEAFRAKAIAEKKLQDKEYEGARKFILKAQQLYPEMENILQLLSVCDVHCSAAENKMVGNDKDWYGILQVEQTADEISIKKQYRRLALLLHPDKNQFTGAEAAFKLIGEAQRILLDKEKRGFHDMKRKTYHKPVISHQPPKQANKNIAKVRQCRPENNFPSNPNADVKASNIPNQRQKHEAHPANGKETFWTRCLSCSIRYQYYREIIGRTLRCQSCKKPFVAFDMNGSGSGTTEPFFPKKNFPSRPTSNMGQEAQNVKPTSDAGFQADHKAEINRSQKGPNKADSQGDEKAEASISQKGPNKLDSQGDEKTGVSRSQKRANKVDSQGNEGSNLQKPNDQRRKKQVGSSESFESDRSSDLEKVEIHEHSRNSEHLGSDGDHQTRRSNRNKRNVSYDENVSNHEKVAVSSKKAKGNASTDDKVDASNTLSSDYGEECRKKQSNMDDKNETLPRSNDKIFEANDEFDSSFDTTPESTPSPTYVEYPDPEFCDFDKDREEHCFKVGQIWAAYDTVDAMPRFYAMIKKVFVSGFKLKITWLEADPDDDAGKEWVNLELPFSCGKFMLGDTETTEDRLMFSHVVSGCKSTSRNSFVVYPKVGETWAMFKNWDANWCSLPENERKFDYEFAEILSEYDKTVGVQVAPLGKLKGFASLFCRKSNIEIQIPPSEILRFSHMVPSYRTTGNEKKAVPKGSIELDPGSTTMNLEEITVPQAGRNAHATSDDTKGNKDKHKKGHR